MAQKFRLKAEKWNRQEKQFDDLTSELGLASRVFDSSKPEDVKAFASKATTLLFRGFKLCAFEETDRDSIEIDLDSLYA